MRKPKMLLALMAGVVLAAFLPINDASAVESDPASREEARQYVLLSMDAHYKEAITRLGKGHCLEFREQLQWFDNVTDEYVREYAREYKVYLSRVDRLELLGYAKFRARLLRKYDCPPKGQAVTTASNVEISIGGGASSVWVPQMPIGTERKGDEETFVTKTEEQLNGSSLSVNGQAAVGFGLLRLSIHRRRRVEQRQRCAGRKSRGDHLPNCQSGY